MGGLRTGAHAFSLQLCGKGRDIMCNLIGEDEINCKCSDATYIYDDELGWINIKLFLCKIRKYLENIEQELGNGLRKSG
ncbi:MAG TPA: hypothetical protein PK728_11660 [Bacillota bacterium]|nr:hypothetical protein [Bacillota bacterium]